jgi:hypothetical protein
MPRHFSQNTPGVILESGWVVCVALTRPIGANVCYVGEVQAVNERGIRITAIDWIIGSFTGADFYFPWDNIDGLEIFTRDHDLSGVDLGAIQTRWNDARKDHKTASNLAST